MEIESAKMIEIIGIRMKYPIGRIVNLKKAKFKIIEKIPIKNAVISERVYVARAFSSHDLRDNVPITKSREVLAIKGPLKLPLRDKRAGIINIKTKKLSK